jgi:hypothetical protein
MKSAVLGFIFFIGIMHTINNIAELNKNFIIGFTTFKNAI